MQRLLVELLGLVAQALQVRAGREVVAEQLTDHVGLLLGVAVAGTEALGKPMLQLVAHHSRAIVVVDGEAEGKQVAQQGEGLARQLGQGAPGEQPGLLGLQLDPGAEGVQQSRLAHPGLAGNRDQLQLALLAHALKRLLQARELGVTTDQARLDTLDAARAQEERPRLGASDHVDRVGLGRIAARLDGEQAADVAVRVVGDEDAVGGGSLLQLAGECSRAADGAQRARCAKGTNEHHAGGDADAQRKRERLLLAKGGQRGLQGKRSADGALGVVLAGGRSTPDRQQRIVAAPLKQAAVLVDHRVEALPERAEQLGGVRGVEVREQGRGANQHGREDGRLGAPWLGG